MNNELDFRVGDVVCDIRYGTGRIEEIEADSEWPICVNFGDNGPEIYLYDGRELHLDNHRALYHGTLEQVFGNLPDLKPGRKVKRWVNLCDDGTWTCFNSKDEAEKAACRSICLHIAVAIEIEVDE